MGAIRLRIQNYKTITNAEFKNYLQKKENGKKERVKALSSAMRTERKDLWVQRNLMIEHFKNLKL